MKKRRKSSHYRDPVSPELRARNDEIASARFMGGTIRGIALACGLSPTHVWRIVRLVPVEFRRPKRPRKSRERPARRLYYFDMRFAAVKLRRLGFSFREIAGQLGCSHAFAFTAGRRVKMFAELRGRAWLSHQEGRPRAWKRELLARTEPPR